MDNKYRISVMIITFNRKMELLRALESCIDNGISDMEIIIVDNHSIDGTQDNVEKYLKNVGIPYKYYYSDKNLGVSEGRNVAFRLCEGEFVFCLDDDAMIVSEHFFERLYRKMKSDDAVAASVEIFEPQNNRFLKGYLYQRNGTQYVLSYIGAAHALKREFFLDKPLYPSTMKFGSEESYIAYKLRKKSLRIYYYGDLKVHHLPSNVARVIGRDRILCFIINTHLIRWMCYPKALLPLLAFTFGIRLISHGFVSVKCLHEIQIMVRERYDENYVERMPLKHWIGMLKDTSLIQLI